MAGQHRAVSDTASDEDSCHESDSSSSSDVSHISIDSSDSDFCARLQFFETCWLLPKRPHYSMWKRWQKEVLDSLIQMCARIRIVEVCILFLSHCVHPPPSDGRTRHHFTLDMLRVPPVHEFVLSSLELCSCILTLKKPRCWPFLILMQIAHFFLLLADYWFPQLFPSQGTFSYERMHPFATVHWVMNFAFLMPFVTPIYRLVPILIYGYIAIVSICLVVIQAKYCHSEADVLDLGVSVLFMLAIGTLGVGQRRSFEKAQQRRFLLEVEEIESSRKVFHVLESMLPTFVVGHLLDKESYAKRVNRASILFVKIENFEQISSQMEPRQLLTFLNDVFTEYDKTCDEHAVTKIETIGEEYVCAVGVTPEEQHDSHAEVLGQLFRVAATILGLEFEHALSVQMGIHTGPVVAGVVGRKLPRFRLFGDTINTTARMMQKGLPQAVQFGEETRAHLPSWVQIEPRGLIEMKGKGQVMTYLFRNVAASTGHGPSESMPTLLMSLLTLRSGSTMWPSEPMEEAFPRQKLESTTTSIFANRVLEAKQNFGPTRGLVSNLCTSSFSLEDTEDFLEWFWQRRIKTTWSTEDSRKRSLLVLDAHLLGILFLTILEGMYAYLWLGESNMIWFEVFRGMACLTLLGIRIVAGCNWAPERWRTAMILAVLCRCVIVTLMFASYWLSPLLLPPKLPPNHLCTLHGLNLEAVDMMSVLVGAYLMTTHQYLLRPAFATAILPITVIGLVQLGLFEGTRPLVRVDRWFLIVGLVVLSRAFLWDLHIRKEYKAEKSMSENMQRISDILDSLLPTAVADELQRNPEVAPIHEYLCATIAQSDLCGFTQLASTLQPEKVVEIISELFGLFDELADSHEVYKVETVGDAYIAGQAEYPLTNKNSPTSVAHFGLGMVQATQNWARKRGVAVNCRVGIHHGRCIGGVVGQSMQRYHLFGQMMASLEVLESTAPEGRVQISPSCHAAIHRSARSTQLAGLSFRRREEPVLKTSKGVEHSYNDVGGQTFIVSATEE